mgnify:CR=1 FL=1
MSLNFSELIIWLLPGFLGLFVFKRIVQEDIDKRGESTQIAIALLFGILSVGLLHLIHRGFIVFSANSELEILGVYMCERPMNRLVYATVCHSQKRLDFLKYMIAAENIHGLNMSHLTLLLLAFSIPFLFYVYKIINIAFILYLTIFIKILTHLYNVL